jgi:hypothetical protein
MNILQSQPVFRMRCPYTWWRQPFFYIAESPYIQGFSFLCIFINTIVLGMEWYGQPVKYGVSLENVNFIFAIIFTIEISIKIIGYGFRFFRDPWNTFDIIIVFITIVGIIINSSSSA